VDPEEKRREEKRRGENFGGFRPVGAEAAALLGEGGSNGERMLLRSSPTMLATRTTMTTSRGLD